jgi:hypothetical protein
MASFVVPSNENLDMIVLSILLPIHPKSLDSTYVTHLSPMAHAVSMRSRLSQEPPIFVKLFNSRRKFSLHVV